ncbi:MAG TPA: hypothetical protein DCR93_21515, partial [Cytophagales bacterium]|nr:hypothetical protein [Cytophagales bacterium]
KLTTKFTALLSILTLVFLAGLSTEQSEVQASAAFAPPPLVLYSWGYFSGTSPCYTFSRCSTGYQFNVEWNGPVNTSQIYEITLNGTLSGVCPGAAKVQSVRVSDCE